MYAKCGSMSDALGVFCSLKQPNLVAWNVLILGYAENGQGYTALKMFKEMRSGGMAPNSVTFLAVLKACTSLRGRRECSFRGKGIHNLALEMRCDSDIYVQSTLIDMYAKCNCMVIASNLLTLMKHPDAVSWNVLIMGYADHGQHLRALSLFLTMRTAGLAPDSVTFVAALKACTAPAVNSGVLKCREWGKVIHTLAVEKCCDSDILVQNTLIVMYAKLGFLEESQQLLGSMKQQDAASWTPLILGYAENGLGLKGLNLFKRMRTGGVAPDSVTFVAALKACTALAVNGQANEWVECRERGKQIHNLAVDESCHFDAIVTNVLIDLYGKCGSMTDARQSFDSMKHPDVVSWTALILGYADNGEGLMALELFTRMRREGPGPNSVTCAAALKACGLVGGLEFGKTIHSEIDTADHLDVVLVTSLVDFYAKCGSLVEAQGVFDMHAETRNVVTWTALLRGFSSCGDHESAFGLFQGMREAGVFPNAVTLLCILMCCNHAGLVEKGKQCFDAMLTTYGLTPTVEHYTCLVDLFGRANKLDEAMALLESMSSSPNNVTWTSVLGACAKCKNLEIGRLAFQSLINLNDGDAPAYVLMGKIYRSRGMLQEQKLLMRMGQSSRTPGVECVWTNEAGEVHSF